MAPENFRMIKNDFLDKYPYVVTEQALLIILGIKSSVCMAKNIKETKHTRQISIIMHFVRIGERCNLHKTVWREEGLQPIDIGTNNFREE